MKIEYDETKNERNIKVRGISFDFATEFDFGCALILEDNRRDYGERRFQAIGFIGNRLHVMVFTSRQEVLRFVSLRKANKREAYKYEKEREF